MMGALIFKSSRSNLSDVEITLTFADARAFELQPFCEGFAVEIDDGGQPSPQYDLLKEILEPGLRIYMVKTKKWQGYIVAGEFRHEESRLVFTSPERQMRH
jgi:hypothetical protein